MRHEGSAGPSPVRGTAVRYPITHCMVTHCMVTHCTVAAIPEVFPKLICGGLHPGLVVVVPPLVGFNPERARAVFGGAAGFAPVSGPAQDHPPQPSPVRSDTQARW
jgi:hypothetical protein